MYLIKYLSIYLHAILSTKRVFANGAEPTHANFSGAECRLRKRYNVAHLYRLTKFLRAQFCYRISIVFFYHHHRISIFLFYHHHHISIFPSKSFYKRPYKLTQLIQFVSMSQVVKNNHGFLQLLAVCPAHQRHFLLRTATPQQLHGLVQVLFNVLKEYILMPEENKRNVYKDALVNLAGTNVPYKT